MSIPILNDFQPYYSPPLTYQPDPDVPAMQFKNTKEFLNWFFTGDKMNNKKDVSIFKFNDKEVRTIEIDGKPYFVAKDVCDVLDIKNVSMAVKRLTEKERAIQNIGRQGNTNLINESGLYKLIFTSNKPEAESFTSWVTDEVLPAIRKTGGYSMDPLKIVETIEADLKKDQEAVKILNGKIDELERQRAEIELKKYSLMHRCFRVIDSCSDYGYRHGKSYIEISGDVQIKHEILSRDAMTEKEKRIERLKNLPKPHPFL